MILKPPCPNSLSLPPSLLPVACRRVCSQTLSREALETMMQQFDLVRGSGRRESKHLPKSIIANSDKKVIVGPDQVVNVAARVSKNAYLELRAAARQALQVRAKNRCSGKSFVTKTYLLSPLNTALISLKSHSLTPVRLSGRLPIPSLRSELFSSPMLGFSYALTSGFP